MPEIRLIIKTGFTGGEHEKEIWIDDDEWERLTPAQRRDRGMEEADAYVAEEIERDWDYVDAIDEVKWPTKEDER